MGRPQAFRWVGCSKWCLVFHQKEAEHPSRIFLTVDLVEEFHSLGGDRKFFDAKDTHIYIYICTVYIYISVLMGVEVDARQSED